MDQASNLTPAAPALLASNAQKERDLTMSSANGPTNILAAARAEALFASGLPACSRPTGAAAAAAIKDALQAYGGTRGCACEVAAAYGEYPETAAPRMRWARQVVQDTFPRCPGRRRKPPKPATTGTTAPGAHIPAAAATAAGPEEQGR